MRQWWSQGSGRGRRVPECFSEEGPHHSVAGEQKTNHKQSQGICNCTNDIMFITMTYVHLNIYSYIHNISYPVTSCGNQLTSVFSCPSVQIFSPVSHTSFRYPAPRDNLAEEDAKAARNPASKA